MRAVAYATLAVAAIVTELALFLGALELVLRTTHLFGARVSWSQPDDRLGYRYTPGRTYWHFQENDHPITGRINSLGWRDRERSREKPAGTFRVALLGDSQVEALPVELDSSFAAIVERSFAARGTDVEMLNLGRSSMTTTEQLLVLESDAFPLDPDVVMLFFMPVNDVADVRPETAGSLLRPFWDVTDDGSLVLDDSFTDRRAYRTRVMLNPLKQWSALVSLATERYNAIRRARAPQAPIGEEEPARIRGALTLCTDRPDPAFAASFAHNLRLLEEIASRCRERGVPFVIVACPWIYRTERIEAYTELAPGFDPSWFERELGLLAERTGCGFLGLQTPFREAYERDAVPLTWGHWNYEGHRFVARLVVREIRPLLP